MTDAPALELHGMHFDGREEVRPLADGSYGIGRAADNWLAPLDTALSRCHSRLEVRAGEVWIEGLPSRNGTLVNGRRIATATRLDPGDEARVGRTLLRVESRSGRADGRRLQATIERVGGRTPIALDVRLVAATHRDLAARIADGSFRHDLYYRIATLNLEIPPLRDRPDDLAPLVAHFLAANGRPDQRLGAEALDALRRHPFPGNVRELASLVTRASILAEGELIEAADLGLGDAEADGDDGAWSDRLLAGLIAGEVDFWDEVHRPFVARDLSRATLRAVVADGLAQSGGSVKRLAELFHTPDRYRKLLDFLRNNRLLP